jgi:hypothetical protein
VSEINPRLITTNEGVPLFTPDSVTMADQAESILDRDWAKSAFMISDAQFTDTSDIQNRYWSSAGAKYTDTRLGCNIGINPKPQFTQYSDIRARGRQALRDKVTLSATNGNHGMGEYYSEAIDDPAQTIYMRFGVPQFNSLSTFLANAFDPDMSALARTGRATGIFYNAAKIAGTITTVVAFPMFAAFVATGKLLNFIFSRPTSKFYTLKPAMHMYWSAVQTLVNNMAINRGVFPKILNDDVDTGRRLGQPYVLDQDYLDQLSGMMPDVFRGSSFFDIYSIANRGQRMANKVFLEDYEKLNNGTATDYTGYLKKEATGTGSHTTAISKADGGRTLSSVLNALSSLSYYVSSDNSPRTEQDPRVKEDDPNPNAKKDPSFFDELINSFDAEFRDGSQFAIFKVNHTGSVSESFSSSVVESDISSKLNSTSSQMRQARFAFAEGNVIGGAAGAVIGGTVNAAKDVALGALDGLSLGFSNLLVGLGGSGYIDIPKSWQSSSVSLPTIQYSMDLISPYGNAISQIMNIDIPLAMILAGTLPLSTGKSSYGCPFLCQIFDRGRNQIKLGMIQNLNIERGTSNLPFNTKGKAMALKVTFSVVDLSSIMHMPISSGSLFSSDAALDEDNILTDYLAVLAGQGLYEQLYAMPKAKLRVAKTIQSYKKLTSPAYWASMVHESASTGLLNDLTLGATGVLSSIIEGAARGAEATAGPGNQ